jgi:hypothetical protein
MKNEKWRTNVLAIMTDNFQTSIKIFAINEKKFFKKIEN